MLCVHVNPFADDPWASLQGVNQDSTFVVLTSDTYDPTFLSRLDAFLASCPPDLYGILAITHFPELAARTNHPPANLWVMARVHDDREVDYSGKILLESSLPCVGLVIHEEDAHAIGHIFLGGAVRWDTQGKFMRSIDWVILIPDELHPSVAWNAKKRIGHLPSDIYRLLDYCQAWEVPCLIAPLGLHNGVTYIDSDFPVMEEMSFIDLT